MFYRNKYFKKISFKEATGLFWKNSVYRKGVYLRDTSSAMICAEKLFEEGEYDQAVKIYIELAKKGYKRAVAMLEKCAESLVDSVGSKDYSAAKIYIELLKSDGRETEKMANRFAQQLIRKEKYYSAMAIYTALAERPSKEAQEMARSGIKELRENGIAYMTAPIYIALAKQGDKEIQGTANEVAEELVAKGSNLKFVYDIYVFLAGQGSEKAQDMAEHGAEMLMKKEHFLYAGQIYAELAKKGNGKALVKAKECAEKLREKRNFNWAAEIYVRLAGQEDRECLAEIEECLEELIKKEDHETAVKICIKLAEEGSVQAQVAVRKIAERYMEKGLHSFAVKMYLALIKNGGRKALIIAERCAEELMGKKDYDSAVKLYVGLAKQGSVEAQNMAQKGALELMNIRQTFYATQVFTEFAGQSDRSAQSIARDGAEELMKVFRYDLAGRICVKLMEQGVREAHSIALQYAQRIMGNETDIALKIYIMLVEQGNREALDIAKECIKKLKKKEAQFGSPYAAVMSAYSRLAGYGDKELQKTARNEAEYCIKRGLYYDAGQAYIEFARQNEQYRDYKGTSEELASIANVATEEEKVTMGFAVTLEEMSQVEWPAKGGLLCGRCENRWLMEKEEAGEIIEVLRKRKEEIESLFSRAGTDDERSKLIEEYRVVIRALVNLAKWHNPGLSEILSYAGSIMNILPKELASVFYTELAELDNPKARDYVMKYAMSRLCPGDTAEKLLRRLSKEKYLDDKLMDLIDKRRELGSPWEEDLSDLREVYEKLGINPDKDLMDLVWGERYERTEVLAARRVDVMIKRVKREKEIFERIEDPDELINYLTEKKERAIIFYALYGGRTKYALVNDYNSIKFYQILEKAKALAVHEGPIDEFRKALIAAGHTEAAADEIILRLRKGQWPIASRPSHLAPHTSQVYSRVIRVDVSHGGKLEEAEKQMADIFGNNQLGAVLKYAVYIRYLSTEPSFAEASEGRLRAESEVLPVVNGMGDLPGWIAEVERRHPEYSERAQKDLTEKWKSFGEKLVLELSLHAVFNQSTNPVNVQRMLEKLEVMRGRLLGSYRQDRLRGDIDEASGNRLEELKRERNTIQRKMRNLQGEGKEEAIARLKEITREIKLIERRKEEARAEAGSQEWEEKIRMLEEKGRDELIRFLVEETIGETDQITQNMLQEWKSHISSALDMYEKSIGGDAAIKREEKQVRLRYLDRRADFVEMFRFADAAQCCFNSRNYVIGQGTGAADWIARLGKDPLSFIFAIEEIGPEEEKKPEEQRRRRAIGFVFGSFGVEEKMPVILLNGVYMEGKTDKAAQSIVNTIEEDFSRPLRMKRQYVASKHGGTARYDTAYKNEKRTVKRLRALAKPDKQPEDKIYDDLALGVNKEGNTGDGIWSKEL